MKTGESAFIYDPNALVITCSSGNLLSIKNSNGKDISFDSRGNGISIIRLRNNYILEDLVLENFKVFAIPEDFFVA